MLNKTDDFLDKIDKIANQVIPDRVMNRAKQALLDYICVTLAGRKYQEDKINKYLEFAEPEKGQFTAIGIEKKLNLKDAVFLNGLNGHALDFDDGTNIGIIHLGSPVFSVLLPISQKYHLNYEQVLKAAIIGYETSFTMAVSIQPRHKMMGYHATGTCGVLGATIAICYALDFNENERKHAFAAACVSATGMLKVLDDGSELKPYNVAKTALLALLSVQMAKADFKGHSNSLAGDRGYLKLMTGNEDIVLQNPLYNGSYAIEKTYTKPYAACRYCHPSIEAAIKTRKRYSVEDIETIHIKTYSLAVRGHEHIDIPSISSAKMSIPYSVAVGIIYGNAGLSEYSHDLLNNDTVISLTQNIKVTVDKELSRSFPEKQTAIVEIITKKGTFSERVDFPKGEPENPMTEEEFKNRFVQMCLYAGKEINTIENVYESVMCYNGTLETMLEHL